MKTLIAIPCMDMMPTGFVQSLLYLEKGENVSVAFKANSLVYDSRNQLSLYAIEQGFDRVMWFDSDMMFTPKIMKILHEDMDRLDLAQKLYPPDKVGLYMVSGIYFKRRSPFEPVIYSHLDEPCAQNGETPRAQVTCYRDYPHNELFSIKGCGFGCVMTSVPLLKKVWDEFGPAFSPLAWGSEDISFCHRVNLLGVPIFCDSRVVCGHIGQFVYTEDNTQRGE